MRGGDLWAVNSGEGMLGIYLSVADSGFSNGTVWFASVPHEREKTTSAEVARRSGIDKAALSRLENGLNANPTFKTLEVIARSIGVRIRLAVEEVG